MSLATPNYSEQYFELIDQNRHFWKTWLPWVHEYQNASDCAVYIQQELSKFAQGQSVFEFVFYRNQLAGGLGIFKIDPQDGVGEIGFFLGQEFVGKGIMTLAVRDLVRLGFEYFSLQKIEIRPALDNVKSQRIAKRLEFVEEGTLRRREKVYDRYHDLVVYGLLKEEWPRNIL